MKSRHRAREVALQILYRYDVPAEAPVIQGSAAPVRPLSVTQQEQVRTPAPPPPQGAQLLKELVQHFDHFGTPEGLREFATQLVAGTLQHLPELDEILERCVANWKMTRLGFVDRSLLRMATYELKHLPETPASVVIDEAIELAKEFGTEDTPSFVNGVLDALKDSMKKQLL